MIRRIALAAAVALTVVAPVGTAAAATRPRPVKAWAGAVCSSIDAWSADLQQRLAVAARSVPDEVTPGDARRVLVASLTGLADRTDELVVVLKVQGAPAGSGGAATSRSLLRTYRGVAAGLRDASDAVAAAPTDDPAAFTAAVEAATTEAENLLAAAAVDFSSRPRGGSGLAKAIAADNACRAAVQR